MTKLAKNQQVVLGSLALIAGLLVGAAVVAFRELIDALQIGFFGAHTHALIQAIEDGPAWRAPLVVAIGGVLVSLFYRYMMPGGRPEGVAQVIAASASKSGRVSPKKGLFAALGSALSIGVGGSVGREGPVVHLGAALTTFIAENLRLTYPMRRTLMGCGAAAAVAASFNAPIAGALFAHEVVLGHYAMSAFAPVVIASVAATMVTRSWFGDELAFTVPDMSMTSMAEFPAIILLGLLCGAVAIIFMRSTFFVADTHKKIGLPQHWRPAAAGLGLAVFAVVTPDVLGVGYEITDQALSGFGVWHWFALLAVAKVAASALCLGSGYGGGIFSPSLAVGALVGAAFGGVAALAAPDYASSQGLYAMIGMGALASAVLGAPISTTLIVFELTGDYGVTVAAMVAVSLASVVVHQVKGFQSFFHWQLERQGLVLRGGREVSFLRELTVAEVMRPHHSATPASLSLPFLRQKLQSVDRSMLWIVNGQGRYLGPVTLADMGEAAFKPDLDDLCNAYDLARRDAPYLRLEDNLEDAMALMVGLGVEMVAVVDNDEERRFVGSVSEKDLLLGYNRRLFQAKAEEEGLDLGHKTPFSARREKR